MTRLAALRYIKNTNGGATPQNFWEDWDPVGVMEWSLLTEADLVFVDSNMKIFLTPKGEEELAKLEAAR